MTRETDPALKVAGIADDSANTGTPGSTDRRNPTVWPRCSGCDVIWRQSGNRTGHCATCHRTSQGISAGDRHRHEGACLNPGGMTTPNGRPVFELTIGAGLYDKGTEYWAIAPTERFIAWRDTKRAELEASR